MDILKGLLLLLLSEMGASEIVVVDSNEQDCNFQCSFSRGEFCLGSKCVRCSYCPEDPFDVDRRGKLIVFRPCIRYGFCPKICSSYLALGSHPRANNTLCEKIRKPKVTTLPTTQPVSTTAYETTTSDNHYGIMTSERTKFSTSPAEVTTNGIEVSKEVPVWIILIIGMIVLALIYASVRLYRKLRGLNKPSVTGSPAEDIERFLMKTCTYEPLEVHSDAENKTAIVKGLQRLNCNALQLCACFRNPDYPAQNWIPTGGSDEMQLPGPMIPHKVYTVKAGRVNARNEFECIAESKVKTEDYAVRLMGGSNRFEGRVEVYHRRNSAGLWGTICNDYWGYADAKVICRQLKYGNPDKAQESNGDYYKGGSAGMEVLLDNVGCDGDEATLASCYTLGWDIENCHRNTELAAVVCEPAIQQGYLTVGAIAGIVTGSVLFIVFVMMLIAVCCRHIKNKKRLRTDPINHGPIVTYISHGAAAPGVNLPPGNQFVNMQYNVATVPRPPTYSVVGPAGSAVDYQQPPTPGSTLAGTGGT